MPGEGAADPVIPEHYFFISHAGTAPSDHWLRTFHDDLTREVRRRMRIAIEVGFVDLQPAGDERDAMVAGALGGVRVLVPLYSPEYFARPSREEATFRDRLAQAGVQHGSWHIQPVLWEPVDSEPADADLDRACALGGYNDDYIRLGLRALCKIAAYSREYHDIVRRLATRIIEVAEADILPPVVIRSLIEPSAPATSDAAFVIAVAAPYATQMPHGRNHSCYGIAARAWRPYQHAHDEPIAEYSAHRARSLQLPIRIVDFGVGDAGLHTSPGVILVDPWMLAHHNGPALLRAALATLRLQWVTVVLVCDRNDPQYDSGGMALADRAKEMGERTRGVMEARNPAEFDMAINRAVYRTRQRWITRPGRPIPPAQPPPPPPTPPTPDQP